MVLLVLAGLAGGIFGLLLGGFFLFGRLLALWLRCLIGREPCRFSLGR